MRAPVMVAHGGGSVSRPPDPEDPMVRNVAATSARVIPECRRFTVQMDPDECTYCRLVSAWSIGRAFDRFVRDVGLLWIERYLDYFEQPRRYARFAF